MDSGSAKGGKMVESDEQPERGSGSGAAMAALHQCELIQNMIDISISSLQGLRTKCAASNDLTQQEIRTLEVMSFSHVPQPPSFDRNESKLRSHEALMLRPPHSGWILASEALYHRVSASCGYSVACTLTTESVLRFGRLQIIKPALPCTMAFIIYAQ